MPAGAAWLVVDVRAMLNALSTGGRLMEMQFSNSTHGLATTILGLLLGIACSSDGQALDGRGSLGGNVAKGGGQQGGSVAAPGSGGGGTSGSGGSLSGSGGNLTLGGSGPSTGGTPMATGGTATSTNVGGTSTGGSNATNTGGASTGGIATGGQATGGAATGGARATGGAATGGRATGGVAAGGAPATGGIATGGRATGGVATGGAPTGGVTTGGQATGGIATGGLATGGVATGGRATGGVATGGVPTGGTATGGRATGGTATGGVPATGGASGTVSCSVTLPASTGTKTLSASQSVSGTFDGGMVQYCGTGSLGSGGDAEGQDPLFNVANGGTLKNVILGGPGCSAADGVHCAGSCTLENVWWGDVGEDAATFRGGATKVVIKGGGAFNASDKVFQDNTTGGDLVTITNFFVSTAGKLYRSCGTCANDDRHVVIQNVAYKSVSQLVGLNTNNGDTAQITGLVDCGGNGTICAAYTWVGEGQDPPRNGTCSY